MKTFAVLLYSTNCVPIVIRDVFLHGHPFVSLHISCSHSTLVYFLFFPLSLSSLNIIMLKSWSDLVRVADGNSRSAAEKVSLIASVDSEKDDHVF